MLMLCLLMMGCNPSVESGPYIIPDQNNTEAGDEPDTAKPLAIGDSATFDSAELNAHDTATLPPPPPENITSTTSEDIVSVVTVSWTTETDTLGTVEFGTSSDYEFVTPATPSGTSHERLLIGIPPDETVHYRVVVTGENGETASEDHTTSTGAYPTSLPKFETAGVSKPGFRILPTFGSYNGVLIVNEEGEIVWYYASEGFPYAVQAQLTSDGQYMVYNSPRIEKGEGELIWISLNGDTEKQLQIPDIAHDFVQLPDGTLAVIANDIRDADGFDANVAGDQVIEITTDGTQTVVWSSWDHYTPGEHGTVVDGDWTHSNAIDYDPEEDVYYLSILKLGSVIKIDRSTGEIIWTLGGDFSDFTTEGEPTTLGQHHQFQIQDDIITIFINGDVGDEEGSQVVQFELDESDMTATELYRYGSYQAPYVYALGAVSMIDTDTMDITWSTSGYLEQVEDDALTWQLAADLGTAFGYTSFVQTLYAELNQAD